MRPSGQDNFLTYCPFHKGGNEKTPSFSLNVDKGLFHCFTCHESGNLKRLLKMLGVSNATIDAETAIIQPFLARNTDLYKLRRRHALVGGDPYKASNILPETILGVFDHAPQKLLDDGFDPAILKDLEIGYDKRNERTTFPLRDLYGNLAGFSGGATKAGQWPKYKVYQGRRFDQASKMTLQGDFGPMFDEQFQGYTCENHKLLWNYDRVYPRITTSSDPSATVFLVEGFKACIWMMMAGFPNTVALMGSYISDTQQRLLHRLGCRIVLFLDNDEAGRKATFAVGDLLWRPLKGQVFVVQYPSVDVEASRRGEGNTQPDDYELEAVRVLVSKKVTFMEHFNQTRST